MRICQHPSVHHTHSNIGGTFVWGSSIFGWRTREVTTDSWSMGQGDCPPNCSVCYSAAVGFGVSLPVASLTWIASLCHMAQYKLPIHTLYVCVYAFSKFTPFTHLFRTASQSTPQHRCKCQELCRPLHFDRGWYKLLKVRKWGLCITLNTERKILLDGTYDCTVKVKNYDLPLHWGTLPLHCPLDWQVLLFDPCSV